MRTQDTFLHTSNCVAHVKTAVIFIPARMEITAVLYCVPSMALILLVKVQPRVFTAKCSEPQVSNSNGMEGGSGVAKFSSLRTET